MSMPDPPYYAVIFSSQHRDTDQDYAQMADSMRQLAQQQPGYLGFETVRDESGFGISVSYWRSLDDIARWKAVTEHREAQEKGRQVWYKQYSVKVCKVERAYDFSK